MLILLRNTMQLLRMNEDVKQEMLLNLEKIKKKMLFQFNGIASFNKRKKVVIMKTICIVFCNKKEIELFLDIGVIWDD